MNKTALTYLFCIASLPVFAQEGEYRFDDATEVWRLTDNAAGLALDSIRNRGVASFNVQHHEGDFHRVQEGGQCNALQFFTERYQSIGQFLYGYGRFNFDNDRTKDRAWADVYRPYNSNPYFPGSNLPGKYDQQSFDFTAAVGSIQVFGITAGLRLDYKVGDLSRLRDPRSRSELLDYTLTPSFTYTTGNHTIGLSGHYNRRKEEMPSLTTVQGDPNLWYYQLTGMETEVGSIGGYTSFSREWVDHRLGAALSYNFHNGRFNSLTTASIERGSESIYETEKHEPGYYNSYRYKAVSLNRLRRGNVLHQLDLSADWQQAYADEYRQQRIQTNDPETGLSSYHYETLIEYKKRYRVHQFDGNLRYRANFTEGRQTTAYAGIAMGMSHVKNEHRLPTSSLCYDYFDLTAEGGTALLSRRLWLDAEAGYHVSSKAELCLADATADYAVGVLLPDMAFYDADYWRGRLQLTYQFPLTIKGKQNTWFVRAYGEYLKADHSLSASTIGLSIGLFN